MRLVLVMPTGVRVGYDDYFSASPLGIETLAAHARAHADVSLIDMRGKGHDIDDHAEQLLAMRPDILGLSVNSAPHTKLDFCRFCTGYAAGDDHLVGAKHGLLPMELM
jgi:hypothetical protein